MEGGLFWPVVGAEALLYLPGYVAVGARYEPVQ